MYDLVIRGDELKKGDSVILIDILHLIKIFKKSARKKSNKEIGDKFVLIFLKILTCRTLGQVKDLWLLMSKFFGLVNPSDDTKNEIEKMCDDIDLIKISPNLETYDEVYQDEYVYSDEPIGIRNNSPFKNYLKKITESVTVDSVNFEEENPYYCPKLLSYFLDQYLPLIPLFSLIVVPNCYIGKYPNSSSVENHCKNLKETAFKNFLLKKRYPHEFVKKLRNYNTLQRESVIYKGK